MTDYRKLYRVEVEDFIFIINKYKPRTDRVDSKLFNTSNMLVLANNNPFTQVEIDYVTSLKEEVTKHSCMVYMLT